MNEHRKRRFLIWTPVLLALALLISLSGIFTWSPINCWHEDIDIRSGRIRYCRYLFWRRVSERVSATPVFDALQPTDYDAAAPEWHHANTFSPGVHHSPHYRFHSAISQAQTLAMLWRITEFTPAARRQSALALLSAWQRGRSYHAAQPFLDALSKLTLERAEQEPKKPIDASDLPPNEPGNA
ncbi:MAG: hypothetical protein ABIP85_21815 [Chthoniobacteraceae bacterium]